MKIEIKIRNKSKNKKLNFHLECNKIALFALGAFFIGNNIIFYL